MAATATEAATSEGGAPTGRTEALPALTGPARWAVAAIAAVVAVNLAWAVLRTPPLPPPVERERVLPMGDYPALRPWHDGPAPHGPPSPGNGPSR